MPARGRQTEYSDRIEIFERHKPLLSSILRSILGSEVDGQELLQETLEIWLRVPEFEVAEARTFLVTRIAARAIEFLSTTEPHWVSPCRVLPRQDGHARCSAVRSPAKSIVSLTLKALDRLSAAERSAFFLRKVFNCKYREIGRIIGQNEIECRKLIRKAKKHMRHNRIDLRRSSLSDLSQI